MGIVLAGLMLPVTADLVPMSWGFPTLIQNNSLTSLQNNFGWNIDNEFTGISFPTPAVGFGTTSFGTFPTITQTIDRESLMSSFSFMNQHESSQFSYPWMSIGFSPVPSMGFL